MRPTDRQILFAAALGVQLKKNESAESLGDRIDRALTKADDQHVQPLQQAMAKELGCVDFDDESTRNDACRDLWDWMEDEGVDLSSKFQKRHFGRVAVPQGSKLPAKDLVPESQQRRSKRGCLLVLILISLIALLYSTM